MNGITRNALDKLPDYAVSSIERFKADLSTQRAWTDILKNDAKQRAIGYLNALNDTGFISDTERRALYGYITL